MGMPFCPSTRLSSLGAKIKDPDFFPQEVDTRRCQPMSGGYKYPPVIKHGNGKIPDQWRFQEENHL
jgi:hypothetical protein